ncbi:Structural maintenance of chromosomes protein 5 [Paramarasmius palmivorus]|uniref:Structural maintenance of chromosomes protein 5 n=1 Tax=Paramarasmius palmivorus TaxID=297713 RepID=A0AAW0B6N8_9AGAR
MARRTVHSPSPDTDSSKENHDITHSGPSTSQPVVVGKNKGKGRAKDAELEETSDRDAEGDVDDSLHDVDAVEDGSPKGRKRARANTEGASHPRSQTQKAEEVRVQVKTHPRDSTDSFIPGQIVRIQLENFLTYDTANFKCGPYLNMIIGPNGTGKSSIACAIALGLNWSPAILGRAEKIQSFVKNDKENGFIEIELKGLKDQPNLVIRRTLSATAATNTFSLNGRPATGKEVNTKMALLNVQISNLCTFLPQDKVSSFAMMSPQQLLKETQRAAGEPSLNDVA